MGARLGTALVVVLRAGAVPDAHEPGWLAEMRKLDAGWGPVTPA